MRLVAPGVILTRDPGDVGLPAPAPLFGFDALRLHLGRCFPEGKNLSWQCFRMGEACQVAALRDQNQFLSSALIGSIDGQQQLNRVDHITCPKRLSMLSKLLAIPG